MEHEFHDAIRTPEGQKMGPLTPPSAFENLNVKGGDFGGGPAEADQALREFASLKTGGSSSIKDSGKVTIPKEGGPDSQRDGG